MQISTTHEKVWECSTCGMIYDISVVGKEYMIKKGQLAGFDHTQFIRDPNLLKMECIICKHVHWTSYPLWLVKRIEEATINTVNQTLTKKLVDDILVEMRMKFMQDMTDLMGSFKEEKESGILNK